MKIYKILIILLISGLLGASISIGFWPMTQDSPYQNFYEVFTTQNIEGVAYKVIEGLWMAAIITSVVLLWFALANIFISSKMIKWTLIIGIFFIVALLTSTGIVIKIHKF